MAQSPVDCLKCNPEKTQRWLARKEAAEAAEAAAAAEALKAKGGESKGDPEWEAVVEAGACFDVPPEEE